MDENITPAPLSNESHVASVDGGGAVQNATAQDFSLSASELKEVLGKDFKDKESALKSVKDTFSYVGKAGQIEKELNEMKASSLVSTNPSEIAQFKDQLKQINDDLWFEKNPQYKSVRPVIQKMGTDPRAVVESPEFKDIFPKVQGYEENQKLKTVLESNPRLASSSDKLTKAKDIAMRRGRQGEAGDLATQSVMEAYGLNES